MNQGIRYSIFLALSLLSNLPSWGQQTTTLCDTLLLQENYAGPSIYYYDSVTLQPDFSFTATASDSFFILPATPPPVTPLTSVWHLPIMCPGDTSLFIALDALNCNFPLTDSIHWNVPGGIIIPQDTIGRQVLISFSAEGPKTLSVWPENNGVLGDTVFFSVEVKSYEKNQYLAYIHDSLTSLPDDVLFVNSCSPSTCESLNTLNNIKLYAKFGLDENYAWSGSTFSSSVQLLVKGYSTSAFPALTLNDTITLTVNNDTPEQLYYSGFDQSLDSLQYFTVEVLSYEPDTLIQNSIYLDIFYEEETEVDVTGISISNINVNINDWEATISWRPSDCYAPNYHLQIVRFIPGSFTVTYDENGYNSSDINNYVDKEGLSLYTENQDTTITLTLAEGSGAYWFRIRAIGRDIRDQNNIGDWSDPGWAFPLSAFVFSQPDEDKNWIYTRRFSEQFRISEQLSFANGLQQLRQQQTRLRSDSQVVATQTLQDFSGRTALGSLPIPVKNLHRLGYIDDLLTNTATSTLYQAEDFDSLVYSPSLAATKTGYYEGSDNGINSGVADAEGVPYQRTLYHTDGTGRVREQGGVGAEHSLSGGKTVQTFYSGVSQQELNRLFGDEAPLDTTVHKIINIDPNKTANVTYQSKQGQVLATALAVGSDSSALSPLNSRTGAIVTITDTVGGVGAFGAYGSSSRKPLFFTAPTTLTINYSLTPQQVEETCKSICQSCDYDIQFLLHDPLSPNSSEVLGTHHIPAGSCASISVWNANFSRNVDAGSYVLEKRVETRTRNTSTGELHVQTFLEAVRTQYESDIDTELASLYTYLDGNDLEGLYTYLENNYGSPVVNGADSCYQIPLACGETLCIPVVPLCEEESCDPGILDFEGYFNNVWENNFPSYTLSEVLPGYGSDTLNTMIDNMIADGYDCQMLWQTWKQQVQSFAVLDTTTFSGDLGDEYIDYQHNLLESFLQAFEARLSELRTSNNFYEEDTYLKKTILYEQFPADSSHRFARYKYIYYNASDTLHNSCMEYYLDEEGVGTFSALSDSTKHKLYNCIKGANVEQGPATETEILAKKDLVVQECNNACESRSEAFRQALIHEYFTNDSTLIIENYKVSYNSWFNQYAGTKILGVNTNYDIAECELDNMVVSLVEHCKSYCVLDTVKNSQGDIVRVGTEAQIDSLEKALTYDFEVELNNGGSCSVNLEGVTTILDTISYTNFGWAKKIGGNYRDYASGMVLDDSSNIYLIGNFEGTADFDPSANVITLTSNGGEDVFVAKYDSTGNYIWAINLGGNEADHGSAIAIDAQNNIYITGYFKDTVDFDPSGATSDLIADGELNTYIAKYDGDGDLIWAKNVGGSTSGDQVTGLDIALDNSNNVLISGAFYGTVDFDPSGSITNKTSTGYVQDAFIAKYDNSGNYSWVINIAAGFEAITNSITIDDANNIYAAGQFSSAADFDPTAATANLIAGPIADTEAFIAKYNATGSYIWAYKLEVVIGGDDGNNYSNAIEIALDDAENIYLIGDFYGGYGGVDFDLSTGTANSIFSIGTYIVKYNNDGVYQWSSELGDDASFTSIVIDNLGNSIASGIFDRDTDFDPSAGNATISPLEADMFLVRYDSSGNYVDVISIGGSVSDSYVGGYNLSLGQGGDIFVSGEFNRTVDFDPAVSVFTLTSESSATGYIIGGRDAFFTKYNLNEQYVLCEPQDNICFRWVAPTPITVAQGYENYISTFAPESCEVVGTRYVRRQVEGQLDRLLNEKVRAAEENYLVQCAAPEKLDDTFTLTYDLGYHHFTLYYYDRAGNLMKTVPPAGVVADGSNNHSLVTTYRYNSFGQLVAQYTPDADSTYFYYNKLGQLRFSQNAQQKMDGTYSYTRYDYLGRIIEVGESTEQAAGGAFVTEVNNAAFPATGTEMTVTVYTTPASITYLDGSTQRYLQNRVSFTYLDEDGDGGTLTDRHYTYYSYDPHGNVEWLVQETPGLGKNYLRYEYDLLSGNVLKVVYNEGKKDQFYHKYAYDADNRILAVYTSNNGHLWEQDAHYEYYAHGPLKRMEVGEDQLQGIDYTYTIHGWLKAINHPVLDPNQDPGGDGLAGRKTAKDAFGMSLGYYQGDYKNTDTKYNSIAQNSDSLVHKNLYNGNISAWASNQQLNSLYVAQGNPQYSGLTGAQYDYDELNRLIASNFKYHDGSSWSNPTAHLDEYKTSYSYDANGNLQTLDRNAYGSNPLMDRLNYHYYAGTNKLEYIEDIAGVAFGEDLGSQSAGNYSYDAIGNLVKDVSEGIDNITWTVYGKPKSIKKSNGDSLAFKYDASGNRIEKYAATAADTITTFYVRDASGNIMAVYEQNSTVLALKEQPIYGSDRIGQRQEDIVIDGAPVQTNGVVYSRSLGYKRYELKDHLGNVRVVISDKRLADSVDVVTNYNYYAFGMHMPGRYHLSSDYRYGFNGKEKDQNGEFGSQTHYDYGFRIYNPALARFLSIDPLFQSYPWYTPYQFAGNNPIWAVDRDGLEEKEVNPGQQRADAGKKVVEKYLENGTTYSNDDRTFGLDAKCADCSSMTTTILQEAGQEDLFKFDYTGGGTGDGIQGEIQKEEGAANLKDPYRLNDPKKGDIMMWGKHIGVVTNVTDKYVYWANMGVKSKAGIKQASLASEEELIKDAEVYSDTPFWGFWTPPDSEGNGTKPAVIKQTSTDLAQKTLQQQEVSMANTANTSSASPINTSSSSSLGSWWNGVNSNWNQFWSDFSRESSNFSKEINNPYNWTGGR